MIFSHSPNFLVYILYASLWLLSYPSISSAESEIKNLLNKLDSHYYYPQKEGLTSLVADLLWEQQDTSSEQIKFLKKPNFQFKGKLKNHSYEKKIINSARNSNLSGAEKTEHINVLNNYLDVFLPNTLYEKFSNYEGQIKYQPKKSLVLHLREKASTRNTNNYELFVDTKKWRITKIHISQNQEPRNIEGKFFYTRRGGQWVVAEATSEYMVNSQTYTEKTEYSYKRANTFWLVHKIKQTVRQGDHLIRSYRIQLNDYKVNLEN
jgi:hypothetical protein